MECGSHQFQEELLALRYHKDFFMGRKHAVAIDTIKHSEQLASMVRAIVIVIYDKTTADLYLIENDREERLCLMVVG